ncbi:MAG TPA: 50S ribosomal protein L21 [Deinococcales bacterium]|nr:50S ribosomal protein L21 [Deinococcales bacterium]
MYAIIRAGGKQYRVSQGDELTIELTNAEPGETVELPVLMLGGEKIRAGTPTVEGATVKAEVVEHGRQRKISVYKYKAKRNYRRNVGHRQPYTRVRVTEIVA